MDRGGLGQRDEDHPGERGVSEGREQRGHGVGDRAGGAGDLAVVRAGRVEEEDPSPVATALRETEEEIGLSRAHVEILGYLPEYRTGTGFRVTPVVALVKPPFELALDAFEVAEAFEVPLSFLLDPANHQRHSLHYRGALRHFFAMPYGDYFIWGATAGMIRSLTERLGLQPA